MTEHKSMEGLKENLEFALDDVYKYKGQWTYAEIVEKLIMPVIKPHLNSRNLFPDKNKDFEKWANDWLHRFGKTNRSWLWDKYKDSLSSVIDDLRVSTTTKNEGTSLTLGMLEEMYNRAFASEELKTEMDNALKGDGTPDNSRNLLERFVEFLWTRETVMKTPNGEWDSPYKQKLDKYLDEFIESEKI